MKAPGRRRVIPATVAWLVASVSLAGCTAFDGVQAQGVREITMWVEEIDWELHPGVTTKAWAYCAEGDGVEPVFDGPCGVPGPTIHVQSGDKIRLQFRNDHYIPHTVHFHGWHPYDADMNGNRMLGDAMVADPGETVTIEWTAEPAGSFIYHCHFETPVHMEMGMYGAFIVDDPADDAVDLHRVAVLDEWQVRDEPEFLGNLPAYNYFTISGKSFPLTTPIMAHVGDKVRIHMVNAGYEFHAMHLHGYTPDSWEGVAGFRHAVPTDVREVAPGQTVVLDFEATREGVWLFHDHVVPRATAASDGSGFGAYPRGMLTVLVVGQTYQDALLDLVPDLLAVAEGDAQNPESSHGDHDHREPDAEGGGGHSDRVTTEMRDFTFEENLQVEPGTTVTWVNKDGVDHTVTFADGSVDSGMVGSGESWSYTFDEPGTYDYYCKPHAYQDDSGEWQGMVAQVVVA